MIGTVIGERYQITQLLGAGGFGQTFLAVDTQAADGHLCVVKQFKPTFQDEEILGVARRLFKTEADILERLGEHEQIPSMLGYFEDGQDFYLVQEFIDGTPLNREMSKGVQISQEQAIALLTDVLGILEFVHSNRVIHRDIKPDNLIRRNSDGKIVLIDFGAVKEIRTQLMNTGGSGQTGFTVGIGTQGYTATEQLAGRPDFCSDIYSLGMTIIHALTGRSPTQLPRRKTGEIEWQIHAKVSVPLTAILNGMINEQATERYQSTTEVLQALKRMSELPTTITTIPSDLLPSSVTDDQEVFDLSKLSWLQTVQVGLRMAIAATLAATALVLGVRQLGWIESMEISAYDQMTQLKSDTPIDPSIVVVEITSPDLQRLQRPTPSDQSLNEVLEILQSYEPSVIGVDLHRDLPQEPGHAALMETLQSDEDIIVINKIGETEADHIPAPAGLQNSQIGFSDFPVDDDGVVRRSLLLSTLNGEAFYSFATQITFHYLAQQDILPTNSDRNPTYMQLGNTVIEPLGRNFGGYQHVDAAGYQMMINYQGRNDVTRSLTFSDILDENFEPEWIQGNIIMIGMIAPTGRDLIDTPYTSERSVGRQMPGVVIHAQVVNQLVTSALTTDSLIHSWPEPIDLLWVTGWAVLGGSLAWFLRHPIFWGVATVGAIVVVGSVTYVLFINDIWIPVAAPIIALVTTNFTVFAYRYYQTQNDQKALADFVRGSRPTGVPRNPEDIQTVAFPDSSIHQAITHLPSDDDAEDFDDFDDTDTMIDHINHQNMNTAIDPDADDEEIAPGLDISDIEEFEEEFESRKTTLDTHKPDMNGDTRID